MGNDKLCNSIISDHILPLIMIVDEYWSHKSCPCSLARNKQSCFHAVCQNLSDMLHTQRILLPFLKQVHPCCKVRTTLIFPAKITILAGNAFLWMVCSDFLSDFTRSSLSLHPRQIHYTCLQAVSGATVACSAAAAAAVCCISGSCFTSSTPLAIFLRGPAASCWPPD